MKTKIDALHKLFSLEGQVAVVTGGSRGLGLQLAEAFGEFGARVAITARNSGELEAACAHLAELGIEASAFPCDISNPSEIAEFVDWLAKTCARIDILANNAGTNWAAPAVSYPLKAWDKLVKLNLTGPFLLTQAVAERWMIPAKRGRIVNVASLAGLLGSHPKLMGTLAYNTTKAGVIGFTRTLAAEWGPFGITVNALAPGIFRSKMTAGFIEENEADIVAQTPSGRLGGPDDLKGAALLFGSDAGRHITGQVLVLDGGFSTI